MEIIISTKERFEYIKNIIRFWFLRWDNRVLRELNK